MSYLRRCLSLALCMLLLFLVSQVAGQFEDYDYDDGGDYDGEEGDLEEEAEAWLHGLSGRDLMKLLLMYRNKCLACYTREDFINHIKSTGLHIRHYRVKKQRGDGGGRWGRGGRGRGRMSRGGDDWEDEDLPVPPEARGMRKSSFMKNRADKLKHNYDQLLKAMKQKWNEDNRHVDRLRELGVDTSSFERKNQEILQKLREAGVNLAEFLDQKEQDVRMTEAEEELHEVVDIEEEEREEHEMEHAEEEEHVMEHEGEGEEEEHAVYEYEEAEEEDVEEEHSVDDGEVNEEEDYESEEVVEEEHGENDDGEDEDEEASDTSDESEQEEEEDHLAEVLHAEGEADGSATARDWTNDEL